MSRMIITAGSLYADIDVLACAVAYQELLCSEGKEALAVLTAPLNNTVPESVRRWELPFQGSYEAEEGDEYVLVDVSDPAHFASFVDQKKVVQIFDHHPGFEKLWKERLGEAAQIEPVGSCATLIWERFKEPPSQLAARLLATSIFSNTLHFNASITTDRDRAAYEQLLPLANLPEQWCAQYYEEVEAGLREDIAKTLLLDTKSITHGGKLYRIGQLELWDAKRYVENPVFREVVRETVGSEGEWFLTLPSISEGRNYLICEESVTQRELADLVEAEFGENGVGMTGELFLRKEILHRLYARG